MTRHGTPHEAPHTPGSVIHWARLYDFGTRFFGFGEGRHKLTLDLAAIAPGDRVLDVGCGPGTLAIAAKERAGLQGEVCGIDPGAEMIQLAQEKARKAGVDARFQVGLIEAIPFPDQHFDVVLSTLMLHHLPDDLKRRGLREIARVLRPGGRLLAADLSPTGPFSIMRLLMRVMGHGLPKSYIDDLAAMIRDEGFSAKVLDAGRKPYAFILAAKEGPTP
jgi:demethylmenaquinone methyltransferase/2-methoxy-6-polyprenyl-1,4-benzoquinol methylase/phosphoethanolamine N-methyltransferase